MCDYCDCRSHPQIASLSADHETVLDQLSDLGRAVGDADHERAKTLLATLHDLIDGHAAREERGVYTALRQAGVDDGYVARFERDHDQLHTLLAVVEGPDWQQQARDLIRLLGEHIGREETDLFPAAHQLLTPQQWDAVDAAVAGVTP